MQDSPPPEIQWFNTHYIPPEDRLRLACALAAGGTETLWVTQRLANALVKKLLEWLDKQTVQDRRFAEVDHRVAQKSALARAPKQAPRQLPEAESEGAGWLVRSVGINSGKNLIILTFKGDAGKDDAAKDDPAKNDVERALRLRFNPQHLRQWLNVLSKQYRRAGWPGDVWPDWMIEAAGHQPSVTSDLLH
ncbi:hypothetical protein [Sphingomonas sp.]|uniref:hypothetical protein n=1 Tax=Sphingomonas sp. TaxID=28214 RepID=UPI002FCBEF1A